MNGLNFSVAMVVGVSGVVVAGGCGAAPTESGLANEQGASSSQGAPAATSTGSGAPGTGTGGTGSTGPVVTSSGGSASGSVPNPTSSTSGMTSTGTGDPASDSGTAAVCDVRPANPNATAPARNLLCYLYEIAGTGVLSGQQETSWDDPEADMEFYAQNVGAYPAILGGDFLYTDGTTERALAYWNAGGIPMIRYHMGAPPLGDSYENSQGETDLEAVLTPGTAEYQSYIGKLDFASDELLSLQDAGVAVLFAPLHEVQPNGWFWWAKGTGDQFVRLWRLTFDYMTQTRGVNNLVWLMPWSGDPSASVYPGDDYVDLAGPDTYSAAQPFAGMYAQTRALVEPTAPIPLHETGTIPDPEQMFAGGAAPWVLFNVWAGYQRTDNDLDAIRRTYASEYTITRDEVPNLR